MADRAQFQKKLGELLAVAASQNNKMTSQEVQAFFQDDNLTDEQMNLVHEFLMSQKVEVIGYTGTIENTEKTEQEEKDTLSQQEKDYVSEYLIDIEKMAYEFSKEKPKAVICTHISNVTGYILPIAQIFEEAKKYGAITVLDTAQSLGLVPVDIRTIRADIIAFAGHKTLYGPFGIGGFLNITGVSLEETIVGGTGSDSLNLNMPAGAEARYESSSTNINAIAGLNAALEVLNQPLLLEKEKELSNYLKKELEQLSNIKIYLPKEEQDHVGIFSITVDEYLADDVGTIFDEEFDLAVRTGYHCAPWIHEYLGDIQMKGTVRISLGQFNTREDIDKLIEALKTL